MQLFDKFTELKQLLTRSMPDEGTLKATRKEILDIQEKIHDKLATYRMELKKILTKEQQTKLTSFGLERGYFRR